MPTVSEICRNGLETPGGWDRGALLLASELGGFFPGGDGAHVLDGLRFGYLFDVMLG